VEAGAAYPAGAGRVLCIMASRLSARKVDEGFDRLRGRVADVCRIARDLVWTGQSVAVQFFSGWAHALRRPAV
jgi:hypothetical protein